MAVVQVKAVPAVDLHDNQYPFLNLAVLYLNLVSHIKSGTGQNLGTENE